VVWCTPAAAVAADRPVVVATGGDIATAIDAALTDTGTHTGDVLVLPAGSFAVTATITIDGIGKSVSLRGAPNQATILYRPESLPDAQLVTAPIILYQGGSNIRVRGLTLRSKQPSIATGDGKSEAADVGLRFNGTVDFKVEGCRFEFFGNSGILVRHTDQTARGLITRNAFVHNAKRPDGLGLGYGVSVYGSDLEWVDDPKFGTDNFIFIENNTFDFHRHATAGGGAALYVARYNLITNNIASNVSVATQAIDAHEGRGDTLGGGNFFSTRAIEAYHNTLINQTFRVDANGVADPIVPGQNVSLLAEPGILVRGGEALIFANSVSGFRFAVEITGSFGSNIGGTYPIPYGIGYRSAVQYGVTDTGDDASHGAGDLFYWSNSFRPYPSPNSYEFINIRAPTPTLPGLALERDYHPRAKAGYTPYPYPHPMACEVDDISPCLATPLVHYAFDNVDLGVDSGNLHRNGTVLAPGVVGVSGGALGTRPEDGQAEFSAYAPELDLLGEASGTAWVKPAGPQIQTDSGCGAGTIFTKGGNLSLLLTLDNNELWYENNAIGDGIIAVSADVAVGQWTHLGFTRDVLGNVQLYRNGLPLGAPQLPATGPQANDANFVIGYGAKGPSSCEFNGSIDEVKMFDRTLSAAEMLAESKVPRPPPPPKAVPALGPLGTVVLAGVTLLVASLAFARRSHRSSVSR
jgi:hypothetical protein